MSEEQFDNTVPSRVAKLESDSAAMRSDIRGIFAGLDEIRAVLVRIQESSRPNLGGMFLVVVAACTFLVTVGGLAMAPVYRDTARLEFEVLKLQERQIETAGNRFTSADGAEMEDHLDAIAADVAYIRGKLGLDRN